MRREPDERQIQAAIAAYVKYFDDIGHEYERPSEQLFKCEEWYGLYELMWEVAEAVIAVTPAANDG